MNVAELASALPEGAAFGGGLPEAARLVFRMVRVEGAPFRTASIFQYIPGKPDIARVGIAALDTASRVDEDRFCEDVAQMVAEYAGVRTW